MRKLRASLGIRRKRNVRCELIVAGIRAGHPPPLLPPPAERRRCTAPALTCLPNDCATIRGSMTTLSDIGVLIAREYLNEMSGTRSSTTGRTGRAASCPLWLHLRSHENMTRATHHSLLIAACSVPRRRRDSAGCCHTLSLTSRPRNYTYRFL